MAKKLVIVESPAKARTISGYLPKDFRVEASIGHIRDLPKGADEIPEEFKKEKWARLGVDIENGFKPLYVVPDEKKKQVKKLKDALKGVEELYLATDEDREGESISWHLLQILKPKIKPKRLMFNEITKEAILKAIENPGEINLNLVHAQEARRVLDRLYGYEVSPILWRKIAPKLSAGRVQSVAIKLVVERERQRMGFKTANYFDIKAEFSKSTGTKFAANLKKIDGKNLAEGKDFDPTTGLLKKKNVVILDEKNANEIAEAIKGKMFEVVDISSKEYERKPEAPFMTSTLQQESYRKLRYSAKKTMQLAQKLYENGFITYMRTDSVSLSAEALKECKRQIDTLYGAEKWFGSERSYASKVKNAQEAHEAIRPAGNKFKTPAEVEGKVTDEEFKVYELIFNRTLASQMKNAQLKSVTATISDGKYDFVAKGTEILFDGFLSVYMEDSDDEKEEENILPKLDKGEQVKGEKFEAKSHNTKPVSRYTEASLIKELESKGIGRPSTYASIMDTIMRREYVFKHNGALVPTFIAFAVVQLMERYMSHLIDYDFTAEMEEQLDHISLGELQTEPYLKDFYYGGKEYEGLQNLLKQDIDARAVSSYLIGKDENDNDLTLRVGRFGPFVEASDGRKISLPDDLPPDQLTAEKASELLNGGKTANEPIGTDPVSGKKVFKKVGRFGPYIQIGDSETDAKEEIKFKSIPKNVQMDEVDFEKALFLISLPKEVGKNEEGNEIVLDNGRYGPYLKCGGKNFTIPGDVMIFDVNQEKAIEIMKATPAKAAGRGRSGVATPPLKDLGEGILVKTGRYGPYVTDGKTNASVPKDKDPVSLTLAEGKELLAARAKKK